MTSAKSTKKKSEKNVKKIARFNVDVLAIYISEDETPVQMSEAFNLLKERLASKTPPKFEKCIMQIWNKNLETFSIVFKSKEKNKVLETIDINSMGKPSCSEIPIGNYERQSLVFLPLLNKNNVAELFIIHPHSVTSQEVVLKLSRLLENRMNYNSGSIIKTKEQESIHSMNLGNTYTSKSKENGSVHTTNMANSLKSKSREIEHVFALNYESKENNDRSDTKSIYSISSNFINNWYGKLDSVNILQSNSLSPLASIHEELHLLNMYLKEIRHFMNEIFKLIYNAVQEKRKKLQENYNSNEPQLQIVHLPSKLEFIETVEKIKTCLNLAAAHKEIIINPSSEEIINQLFIYLRILADATINHSTGKSDLVIGIKNPQINSSTVKFLTNNLNAENTKFWTTLGFNYGFMRGSLPSHTSRNPIDEFEIKEISNIHEYEQKNHSYSLHRQFQQNNRYMSADSIHEHEYVAPNIGTKSRRYDYSRESPVPLISSDLAPNIGTKTRRYDYSRESPVPLISSDLIYRSFPRLYEPEKKESPYYETENFQYQNVPSHSQNINCSTHINNCTWDDRQCRFIDAVRLRNGRIGKVLYDRSVQNYRELGVSNNEIVEILRDHGEMLSVKNALGEIGECPKTVISEIHNNYTN